ncbi:hypothetical protein Tco_1092922 [Tanacetum coccineum]|uniref:Zinc finger, CCHC-type n=1 Tax=Tanacetum coccineum TaxID=301880 RepID=A0ABQ5IB84_9ASTR
MASMNTRLNIEKLDGNIIQKHGGLKLGSNNLVLVLKQESMKYMMKNVFCLRWNCREALGIVKLRFFWLVTMICWVKDGGGQATLKEKTNTDAWSTQQCMKSGSSKHLGVYRSGLSKVFWAEVALSTTEAEYMALTDVVKEGAAVEDSNEAAFAVAAVEKIYAHESLTFNDIVSSTVAGKAVTTETTITGNIHQAEIWVTKGLLDKAKGNVLGIEIIRDQSGNTLRVSQSKFYNRKMVNGHIHIAVESQVYQGVCTRPDIASADVGMYDRMPHMMALLTTEAGCMTFIKAWKKEAIWLRGLLEELGVELNRVAVNCDNQGAIHLSRNHVFHERNKHINVRYHFIREVLEAKAVKVLKVGTEHNAADALTKVVPGHKLQHCLELLSVGIG